ncbi:hypothetical protein [Steroidobacter agaridevorans]|uniref:hypothetical protein n=1 Tax=Steroidobacter agaridevorans TaxID=2695856 RepID=UPI00137ABC8D|nr:hypothetical protein [Steroidobacter agaridevorans]
MLAATVAGGWNRRKLYPGSGASAQEVQTRREQVEELVQRALNSTTPPDQLAFFAYMDLLEWYEDREAALGVVERALTLYPLASMTEWQARLLRHLNRPNDTVFNTLLARLPDPPWSSYLKEVFDSALALSRYDDASGALDLFEQKLRNEIDPVFDARLAILRAYIELRRALDADPGAAVRGLAGVTTVCRNLSGVARAENLHLLAAKLRLALAAVTGDAESLRESATSILGTVWAVEDAPDYSPGYDLMQVGDETFEVDFGVGYQAPAVVAALPAQEQTKWTLLMALRLIYEDEEPNASACEFIAQHGAEWAPAWAAREVANIILASKAPNARNAGRALVRYCLYIERRFGSRASALGFEYDDLSAAQLGELVDGIEEEFRELAVDTVASGRLLLKELGAVLTAQKAYQPLKVLSDLVLTRASSEPDALFYAALSRQEMEQFVVARSLYERLLELVPDFRAAYWNLTLIHETQGNADALEELIRALEERARGGAESWVKARDRARAALTHARQHQAAADFRAFVSRELMSFPDLRSTAFSAPELSLLEAACLVALLRASELNHSTWTLAPFAANAHPFEPTYKFRSVLLDLAMKGIIRIADSTPMTAFTAKDGRLRYYLDQVHWSISPHTLALHSQIRDMTRHQWPDHWRAHAEILSRDLATEECIAYIEHLAEERKLDPPDQADARALFRELLEHCSVGKCWYYIYSGVQAANDYRTKYPVSRAQVTEAFGGS